MQDTLPFFLADAVPLLLAVVMGGVIGLERQAMDKPAGLRTHMLICVGSTLMMILSIRVPQTYGITAADPGRIAQGVITGIGFLGAGTILHSRAGITGLTTAATTWSVAGIGLALGSRNYDLAGLTTLVIFMVLWALGRFSRRLGNGRERTAVRIEASSAEALDSVRELLRDRGLAPSRWDVSRNRKGVALFVECQAPCDVMQPILSRVALLPGIQRARTG